MGENICIPYIQKGLIFKIHKEYICEYGQNNKYTD